MRIRWLVLSFVLVCAVVPVMSASAGGGPPLRLRPAVVTEAPPDGPGFNALCRAGLKRARATWNIEGRFVTVHASDQRLWDRLTAVISELAGQGYDPVITCGWLAGLAASRVAQDHPKTRFATIDAGRGSLPRPQRNLTGVTFAEGQAGYLAGVAAAFESTSHVIGLVGGDETNPSVVRFARGYRAGATATKPGITVLRRYSIDFAHREKCRPLAEAEIAGGADVIFAVAGACGLGALGAAAEAGVWGIGVDVDQSYLGSFILTSALKRADEAVTTVLGLAQRGALKGGRDIRLTAASGALGFAAVSPRAPRRRALIARLRRAEKALARGAVPVGP